MCCLVGAEGSENIMSLDEILKGNPFDQKLINEWSGRLDEVAQNDSFDWQAYNGRFLLPDDIKAYETFGVRKTAEQIYPQFIPQPFIGHPSADIWLLNINPSWFPSDVYAMLNVSKAVRELKWKVCEGHPLLDCCKKCKPLKFSQSGLGDKEVLRTRQQILLDQLLFKDKTFFPLDKAFDFLDGSTQKDSVRSWWLRTVFGASQKNDFPFRKELKGKDRTLLRHSLFVLELSPYRSSSPNAKFIEDRLTSSYGLFWRELVRYGLQSRKTIIVRAERNRCKSSLLVKALRDNFANFEDRVGWLGSVQSVALTDKNVEFSDQSSFAERVAASVHDAAKIGE